MVWPDIGDRVKWTRGANAFEGRVEQLIVNPQDHEPPLFIAIEPGGERLWGEVKDIYAIDVAT